MSVNPAVLPSRPTAQRRAAGRCHSWPRVRGHVGEGALNPVPAAVLPAPRAVHAHRSPGPRLQPANRTGRGWTGRAEWGEANRAGRRTDRLSHPAGRPVGSRLRPELGRSGAVRGTVSGLARAESAASGRQGGAAEDGAWVRGSEVGQADRQLRPLRC